MSRQVVDYIRQNRETYTREALTAKLVEAGHDPTEIEAAWAELEAEAAAGRVGANAVEKPAQGPGPGTVILGVLVILAYAGAILLALIAISSSGSYVSAGFRTILVIYAVTMAVSGIWSVSRLLRTSSRGQGEAAIFGAFAISVGVFLGLSGLCVVGGANV